MAAYSEIERGIYPGTYRVPVGGGQGCDEEAGGLSFTHRHAHVVLAEGGAVQVEAGHRRPEERVRPHRRVVHLGGLSAGDNTGRLAISARSRSPRVARAPTVVECRCVYLVALFYRAKIGDALWLDERVH